MAEDDAPEGGRRLVIPQGKRISRRPSHRGVAHEPTPESRNWELALRTGMKPIQLAVPLIRQNNNCGCGLAAINTVLMYGGDTATLHELERHPLILPVFLDSWGIGPGRLGRVALARGFDVTLIDPEARVVGKKFVDEGGRWVRRDPRRADIEKALDEEVPCVACIPDKTEAFAGATHHGSHWIVVTGRDAQGELIIHDPAPWRKAVRCKPGYWDAWGCSLLVIRRKPGAAGMARAS